MRNVATTPGGTVVLIGALAGVVWWFIAASPVVEELDRRQSRLDDPDVGRVPRLEKDRGCQARISP